MRIRLDHIFDHLRLRTTWKQCEREHRKASFSDTKAPKSPRNQEKNYALTLRDAKVVGSNPVASTKNPKMECSIFGFFCLRNLRRDLRVGAVLREQNALPYEAWIMKNLKAKDDVDNVGAGRAAKGANPRRLDQKHACYRVLFNSIIRINFL